MVAGILLVDLEASKEEGCQVRLLSRKRTIVRECFEYISSIDVMVMNGSNIMIVETDIEVI